MRWFPMSESLEMNLARIRGLALTSTVLGALYLAFGVCSLIARTTGICETIATPASVSLVVLLMSIGAVLLPSIWFLKNNVVLSIGSSFVGLSLAVGAMIIQLLAVGASWLDGIITGEPLSKSDIIQGVLRGDAILGYIALPFLVLAVKVLKEEVIK
jgi:hypothetical protein